MNGQSMLWESGRLCLISFSIIASHIPKVPRTHTCVHTTHTSTHLCPHYTHKHTPVFTLHTQTIKILMRPLECGKSHLE